jgi:hypothetical protein
MSPLPDHFWTKKLKTLGWMLDGYQGISSLRMSGARLKALVEGMEDGTVKFVEDLGRSFN